VGVNSALVLLFALFDTIVREVMHGHSAPHSGRRFLTIVRAGRRCIDERSHPTAMSASAIQCSHNR